MNKLALGIAIIEEYLELERSLANICPGGHVEDHYRMGRLKLGEEFKVIPNHDYNANGAIRTHVDAKALGLSKNGNPGSDVMSLSVFQQLKSQGRDPRWLSNNDFKKSSKNSLTCEHIITIKSKADLIRKLPGNSLTQSIISILRSNTAVATIFQNEASGPSKKLVNGKDWERYANLPVVYSSTGQIIKNQQDLLNCRRNDPNNSIEQFFDSLSQLTSADWKTHRVEARSIIYRGARPPTWTLAPNIKDLGDRAIIKRNDPIEITKEFWPDHFKKRFLKDKSQASKIGRKYGFSWYR